MVYFMDNKLGESYEPPSSVDTHSGSFSALSSLVRRLAGNWKLLGTGDFLPARNPLSGGLLVIHKNLSERRENGA